MKVFSLYQDGRHINCYSSREAAERGALSFSEDTGCYRYLDIEEEDYEEKCDCGNGDVDI